MKTFTIPCVWQMYGKLQIEANTVEEAIKIAEDMETALPEDGNYVDESFEVDREGLDAYNAVCDECGEVIANEDKNGGHQNQNGEHCQGRKK